VAAAVLSHVYPSSDCPRIRKPSVRDTKMAGMSVTASMLTSVSQPSSPVRLNTMTDV
jgi:hypothetical protein